MKILLVQPLSYTFTMGGAHKANRTLLEGLARRGHDCRALTQLAAPEDFKTRGQLVEDLARRGIPPSASPPDETVFRLGGVEVHALKDYFDICARLPRQADEFEPDWILVSEDKTHLMLAAALQARPSRVVYVSHSPATLPFGPDSFSADPAKAEMLRRTAGIITVSGYMKEYIRRWGGIESVAAIPFPVYGDGPFPHFGRFDQGYVTLINPYEIKGLLIFIELARRLPEVEFAAVHTWGAQEKQLEPLRQLPNVRIIPGSDDVDVIFAQTRVLLAPSLWGEAFGQVVVEAMLRGIPVLASTSGGLPEAKLGVDYVLPVRTIERYVPSVEDLPRVVLVPEVPEQDVDPWERALREVVSDRARYEQLSEASREAAHRFNGGIGIAAFEDFLRHELQPRRAAGNGAAPGERADELLRRIQRLPADRRSVLTRRLKDKLEAALKK